MSGDLAMHVQSRVPALYQSCPETCRAERKRTTLARSCSFLILVEVLSDAGLKAFQFHGSRLPQL